MKDLPKITIVVQVMMLNTYSKKTSMETQCITLKDNQ